MTRELCGVRALCGEASKHAAEDAPLAHSNAFAPDAQVHELMHMHHASMSHAGWAGLGSLRAHNSHTAVATLFVCPRTYRQPTDVCAVLNLDV